MPDDVVPVAPPVETPAADAPPPEIDPLNPGPAPEAAPATPPADAPIDAKLRERVKKELEKEGRGALVALRIEERKVKREFEQQKADIEKRMSALEQRSKDFDAREKELEENPYGYAAKRKNRSELELYNEHTKRLLNGGADSPEDRVVKLEQSLQALREERQKEREDQTKEREEYQKQQRAAHEQRVQGQFQSNVAQMIEKEESWPLLKRNPALFAKVAFDRLKAHHDSHNGELLDIPALLGILHTEIKEDLSGYLPHLQPPQGVSDRDGAGQSAKHEAQSTPRTLTNGIASQTTSRSRQPSAKELAIEGDKILLGRG